MASIHTTDFAATDVLRMFPIFVWKGELGSEVHCGLNDNIQRALAWIRRGRLDFAFGQGWQSD